MHSKTNTTKERSGPAANTARLKIAVTGSAGSGKTAVCNRLKELGLQVISTDVLAREAVEPGSRAYRKIVDRFGETILQKDGTLNRRALRGVITRDEEARRTLEGFVHPEIIVLMEALMSNAAKEGHTVFVVEVPLLFEAGWGDYFDVIVTVSATDTLRIRRLMDRDHVSRDEATALLRAQKLDDERLQHSDYVIKNNGSEKELKQNVDRFLKQVYQKYQKNDKSA